MTEPGPQIFIGDRQVTPEELKSIELPPRVRAEVKQILDREARRILAEQLAQEVESNESGPRDADTSGGQTPKE